MTDDEIIVQAKRILKQRAYRSDTLSSPKEVRDYLILHLSPYEHEAFVVVFLDNRHRVITFAEMFRGSIDGASVHPREVVKEALRRNAAAVIFAHPHPSGVCEPSQADIHLTKRLREALSLVDVRVLDHFVIGAGEATSFAEQGLL